jgi:hypothetical protein
MWRDNPTWGEDRIAGELAKFGYRVSPRTVAKYRPAGLKRQRGQRWTTFIRNHLYETWACDFFVVVTARFRVLYAFVVLSLGAAPLGASWSDRTPQRWMGRAAYRRGDRRRGPGAAFSRPRPRLHLRERIPLAHSRSRPAPAATPPRTPQRTPFASE